MNEEPVFTEPFYIKKFMEIQQQNVILWRKLYNIQQNSELKEQVEKTFGVDFFEELERAPR
jgi:hypothetical protein